MGFKIFNFTYKSILKKMKIRRTVIMMIIRIMLTVLIKMVRGEEGRKGNLPVGQKR